MSSQQNNNPFSKGSPQPESAEEWRRSTASSGRFPFAFELVDLCGSVMLSEDIATVVKCRHGYLVEAKTNHLAIDMENVPHLASS